MSAPTSHPAHLITAKRVRNVSVVIRWEDEDEKRGAVDLAMPGWKGRGTIRQHRYKPNEFYARRITALDGNEYQGNLHEAIDFLGEDFAAAVSSAEENFDGVEVAVPDVARGSEVSEEYCDGFAHGVNSARLAALTFLHGRADAIEKMRVKGARESAEKLRELIKELDGVLEEREQKKPKVNIQRALDNTVGADGKRRCPRCRGRKHVPMGMDGMASGECALCNGTGKVEAVK